MDNHLEEMLLDIMRYIDTELKPDVFKLKAERDRLAAELEEQSRTANKWATAYNDILAAKEVIQKFSDALAAELDLLKASPTMAVMREMLTSHIGKECDRLAAENAEMINALEDIASGEIGINITMRLAKGVLARVKAEK